MKIVKSMDYESHINSKYLKLFKTHVGTISAVAEPAVQHR
jgi:hypothetical protein